MTRPAVGLGVAGRWLAGAGAAFVLTGLLAGLPTVTALGGMVALGLVGAAAWARSIAWRVKHGGLVVHVDGLAAEPRVRVGRPFRAPLRLDGPLRHRLAAPHLTPGVARPAAARVLAEPDGPVLELTPPRVGYAWLQGFHLQATIAGGLLELRTWIPCPLALTVLPRGFPLRDEAPLRATRAAFQDHAGVGRARRRGFGLEIRELRDHQPGDPFKHIAWAATARRGKLTTREFEANLKLSAWILVDVSPSMFWGPPGSARVDFALETAWNLATLLLARGDRVGVMLHDHRVRLSVVPSAARDQGHRILEAVLEAPHLLHEDRTEITEQELVEAVAGWLHAQEGRSFRLPDRLLRLGGPRESAHEELRLLERVDASLAALVARRRPPRLPVPVAAYAREPRLAAYRAYCRHRGIPLPLDPTPRPGGQAQGLEQAVEAVLRTPGGPHTLLVISDLLTANEREPLRRAALGARRHHHALMVICPSDPVFEGPPAPADGPLGEALLEVERLRSRHSLAAVEAILRPAGVSVLSVGPRDVMPRLLQRLDQVA